MVFRWLSAVVMAILWSPIAAWAEEWPQFRGNGGSGLSSEKNLPLEWSADKNVAWKAKISGRGWSSPIVWGDRLFLTAAVSEQDGRVRAGGQPGARPAGAGAQPKGKAGGQPGTRPGGFGGRPGGGGFGRGGNQRPPDVVYRWEIYCLERSTGKVLWKELALESKPRIPTHASNTYASETPVTDGERVYAYFGMTGLFCYDFAGKQLWKKDLGAFPMQFGWGTSSSPVLADGRLFLQIDNEQKSFLIALNSKTGEEIWREARAEKSNWGTPMVWKNKLRTELVTCGAQKVRSYDPATGKQLWDLGTGGGRCTASPIGDEERLYVGVGRSPGFGGGGGGRGGFGGPGAGGSRSEAQPGRSVEQGKARARESAGQEAQPGVSGERQGGQRGQRPGGGFGGGGGGALFAVKAGASGDITPKQGQSTSEGVVWTQPRGGPPMASPLVYQGYVYILEQNGGMISCFDAQTGKPGYQRERIPGARAFWASPWAYDGKVFCLDDRGTTHVLEAGPKLRVLGKNTIDDQFWATPALAGGSLIMRGVDNVYCIRQ